jgi:hypothetical protein
MIPLIQLPQRMDKGEFLGARGGDRETGIPVLKEGNQLISLLSTFSGHSDQNNGSCRGRCPG